MQSPTTTQLLPGRVDALKLCQQGAKISGVLPLGRLKRLSDQLYAADGDVKADLVFGVDDQSRKTIGGNLEVVLPVICQRCLDRLDIAVKPEISLALVWNDDQASHLPRSLDPILMDGEDLDLLEIVEEELLLALPLVAIHDDGLCQPPASLIEENIDSEVVVEKKENPFQVLATLKSEAKGTQ